MTVSFLPRRKPRPWSIPAGGRASFTPDGYYLGNGGTALEVAVARAASRPVEADVRNLWKRRKGNQPSPLLLIVLWADRATACGTTGDDPAVYSDRDPEQLARIAAMALDEADHHGAVRLLAAYLPQDSGGLRNIGLFTTHHLVERLPERADWPDLCKTGAGMLGLRREKLVEALGFKLEPKGQAAILRTEGNARALAVFLDDSENPDNAAARFNGITPVSWAVGEAGRDNIPYVVVTRGPQLRVYMTRAGGGAAGKGGTSAFLELNLPLLTAEDAGYLPLLFSAESLAEDGEFERLLSESHDFAANLGTRLRSRVYDYAVPAIAEALIEGYAEAGGDTDEDALADLCERALLVLFRLLFVAYAEDKGLLPLTTNGLYRQRSLKHLARELADLANEHGWDEVPFDDNATDYWDGVKALWGAVDKGRKEWNVPIYNGGMFSSDNDVSAAGAALADLKLTNAAFGPALLGLLVDEGDNEESFGPVDFASLDVREFGTIYEGLLESNLAVAPVDLTVSTDDTYLPAGPRDDVWKYEGDIYLHNKSGARKASGSYFTKPFAVEHLLRHALEPALVAHVQRLDDLLDAGNEVEAADAFFDFRCVDLSMGSGHFLVAAIDLIEKRLSEFLTSRQIPGVLDELARLAKAAEQNLADAGVVEEGADTNTLLRRQIARRCIYGVDMNPISVELARLALWIHTFVKGLPLTSLNHGLVVGNSLTGIGTLEEALEVLDPDRDPSQPSFVRMAIAEALEAARVALKRFAATSEATAAEVKQARNAHDEAREAVESASLLFDLAVAARMGEATIPVAFDADTLLAEASRVEAAELGDGLGALHFPVVFPEVFLRERPGFDCILGNPPWEEVTVEELGFWALRFPGLKTKGAAEQQREISRYQRDRPDLAEEYDRLYAEAQGLKRVLVAGPYPGMSTGDPDLYKAFAWRFWQLARDDGRIGVVLPRTALMASGSSKWREAVLGGGAFSDVTTLLNTGGWVFDGVEPRLTVALVSIHRHASTNPKVGLRGPLSSFDQYQNALSAGITAVGASDLRSWSEGCSFPLLPRHDALRVFLKMKSSPPLNANAMWRARPLREFHATDDRSRFEFEPSDTRRLWPVYKGSSFNLWTPDTGTYFGWGNPAVLTKHLQDKRQRQSRNSRSAFSEMSAEWARDPKTLPCLHARVVVRDVTNRTNQRTVIAALIPPDVFMTNQACYFVWPQGDEKDAAYLLGVLSSIPLDWYARAVVETHVNYHLLNSFPVPRPDRTSTAWATIVDASGRLAATDDRLAGWAAAVGVGVGTATSDVVRAELEAEIDAAVASLYGLDLDDIRAVFETFHEGWDYAPRLNLVMEKFEVWS